ncbi:MAG: hypothetical protein AAFR59_01935, partial [Bacteroidota bacterium]
DILEIKRAYPVLFDQLQQVYQFQVIAFQEIVRFNIARGAMHQLTLAQLSFLAQLIVHHLHNWPMRKLLNQDMGSDGDLSTFIWNLFTPYLTPSGQSELSILIHKRISWDT